MGSGRTWLLPEGIYEYLPPDAQRIEAKRRLVLDQFTRWGYHLILPPLVDHTENLFNDSHDDLAQRTFQFGDPLTGRMLGIRADITPQAARMDALNRFSAQASSPHSYATQPSFCENLEVSRLCYCGEVVYTSADNLLGRRSLIQCGAEIFGCGSLDADIEIMELMVHSINLCGISDIVVDIGHQGVLSGLLELADISSAETAVLLELAERKAITEYRDCLNSLSLSAEIRRWLLGLPECYGGVSELEQTTALFSGAPSSVLRAIQEVRTCMMALADCTGVTPYFDLAELRSFNYHTGLVFAAYSDRYGQAVAKGGRYDGADLDSKSTASRPATGFSMDLTLLMQVSGEENRIGDDRVWAKPNSISDKSFKTAVRHLRDAGYCVEVALPSQRVAPANCKTQLVETESGQWELQPIDPVEDRVR